MPRILPVVSLMLGITPILTATPNPFRTGVKLAARSLPSGDLSIEVCSDAGRVVSSRLVKLQ